MNSEVREFLIKMVANMSEWEKANGHDLMANRFSAILPTFILYGEEETTVLEDPQEMADFICQAYQDHIEEVYLPAYMKENYPEPVVLMGGVGEVTKVSNVTEVITQDEIDEMILACQSVSPAGEMY